MSSLPTIRLAQPSDVEKILAIYAPFVQHTAITFEYEVPAPQDFHDRMMQTLTFAPWLVCEVQQQIAGYAYAGKHRNRMAYQWSVELSVYVHENYYRKGIAQALYTSLIALLQLQGYYNVYAGITLPNPPSVSFHEHFGFTPVGIYRQVGFKLGAWHDVGWWKMDIQPKTGFPLPPKGLANLQGLPQWEEALTKGLPYIK